MCPCREDVSNGMGKIVSNQAVALPSVTLLIACIVVVARSGLMDDQTRPALLALVPGPVPAGVQPARGGRGCCHREVPGLLCGRALAVDWARALGDVYVWASSAPPPSRTQGSCVSAPASLGGPV